MKFLSTVALLSNVSSALSFAPAKLSARFSTTLNKGTLSEEDVQTIVDKVKEAFKNAPEDKFTPYVGSIQKVFPGAISNLDLANKVTTTLSDYGFTSYNTLLATSLCADELARPLENDFVKIYGNNFNLGGVFCYYLWKFQSG